MNAILVPSEVIGGDTGRYLAGAAIRSRAPVNSTLRGKAGYPQGSHAFRIRT